MSFSLVAQVGSWWLSGPKYLYSVWRSGSYWRIRAKDALRAVGVSLEKCHSLPDVVNVFWGRFTWAPDSFFQLDDWVKPPALLLQSGGDDCDGWAMLHAQAVNDALGKLGWRAFVVSYVAKPFWKSHHFAVAADALNNYWVIEAQPRIEDLKRLSASGARDAFPLIFGPYSSIKAAAEAVACRHESEIAWMDIRTDHMEAIA